MEFIIARLREPSTYAGLAAFIGGLAFLPHAQDMAQSIGFVGGAVAGLLAIWLPEAKK
jgi:hypothetical protein